MEKSTKSRIKRKASSSPSVFIFFGTLVGGPTIVPSSFWNWIVNVDDEEGDGESMELKSAGESPNLQI